MWSMSLRRWCPNGLQHGREVESLRALAKSGEIQAAAFQVLAWLYRGLNEKPIGNTVIRPDWKSIVVHIALRSRGVQEIAR